VSVCASTYVATYARERLIFSATLGITLSNSVSQRRASGHRDMTPNIKGTRRVLADHDCWLGVAYAATRGRNTSGAMNIFDRGKEVCSRVASFAPRHVPRRHRAFIYSRVPCTDKSYETLSPLMSLLPPSSAILVRLWWFEVPASRNKRWYGTISVSKKLNILSGEGADHQWNAVEQSFRSQARYALACTARTVFIVQRTLDHKLICFTLVSSAGKDDGRAPPSTPARW
jgi:hypothetical protein